MDLLKSIIYQYCDIKLRATLEGSTVPPRPDYPGAEPRTEPVRAENIDLSLGAGSGRLQLPPVRFGGGSKCITCNWVRE